MIPFRLYTLKNDYKQYSLSKLNKAESAIFAKMQVLKTKADVEKETEDLEPTRFQMVNMQ